MPKVTKTTLYPKAVAQLSPVCTLACQRGRGDGRWCSGTGSADTSHSAQPATETGVGTSQASRGLIFPWCQPLLYSRRQGGFCFPAHQSPRTSVLRRSAGQHPASRTRSSGCFEGRCSSLKGTFFPASGSWSAWSPEAWELMKPVISSQLAELQIPLCITLMPDLCLKLACMPYLPNRWWLSQVTEIVCWSGTRPVSLVPAARLAQPGSSSPHICRLQGRQRADHRRLRGRTTPGRGVTLASASVTAKKEEKHAPSPQAAREKRNHRGPQTHHRTSANAERCL